MKKKSVAKMGKHSIDNNKGKMTRKEKRNNTKKRRIKLAIRILFLIIVVIGVTRLIIWYTQTDKEKQVIETLVLQVVTQNDDNETEIDFDRLKEINTDIVGWIIVGDTNINYPIVQSSDNDYYLKNNIYKEYSSSGSIFMDYRNNGFTDANTIIYGHNMLNNTMFSDLKKVYDGKTTNNTITIYEEEKVSIYQIFSARIIKPDVAISTSTSEQYITKCLNESAIDFGVEVTEEDKIITLVTCSYNGTQRIIVQGVLNNN